MSALEDLESLFHSDAVYDADGDKLRFEGIVGLHANGINILEQRLNYQLPHEIREFLLRFGGTRLFVNSYGLGTEVFPIAQIEANNLALREAEDQCWPAFVLLGTDHAGNFLCLHKTVTDVLFGLLDREAWGWPDLWATEGIWFAPFNQWLEDFVESRGETLPRDEL